MQHAEAALGVGVLKGVIVGQGRFGCPWRPTNRQLQQRLGSLLGQVCGHRKDAVLVGLAHVAQPLDGHAVAEELRVGDAGEEARLGRHTRRRRVGRRLLADGLHQLAHLDELGRARGRVPLNLAPQRPGVGVVVMIDVAQQQAGVGFVDDDAEVVVDPHRPEVRVPGSIQAMKVQPRLRRVELKVEGGHLRRLLLLGCQAAQAAGEGVCNAKFHGVPCAERLNTPARRRRGRERPGSKLRSPPARAIGPPPTCPYTAHGSVRHSLKNRGHQAIVARVRLNKVNDGRGIKAQGVDLGKRSVELDHRASHSSRS